MVDDDMGQISQSREFGKAIMIYLIYQFKYGTEFDEMSAMIFANPGMLVYSDSYQPYKVEAGSSPQEELYAKMYAKVDGDISKLPVIFQKFYKQDTQYDEIYNHLVEKKVYIKGVITMNDYLKNLWGKVVENKETVLRIGLAVAGTVVGAVVATIVANTQNEAFLDEEVTMSIEEVEETE
jgi:hypothetical protein